jgi:hypothetical protein
MADQERSFTSGDVRVLADVARAVANGSITTNELQGTLNERRVTREKMPVWVNIQAKMIPDSSACYTLIFLFEKRPNSPVDGVLFLATLETLSTKSFVYVRGETVEWAKEAQKRLNAADITNFISHRLKTGEFSGWYSTS